MQSIRLLLSIIFHNKWVKLYMMVFIMGILVTTNITFSLLQEAFTLNKIIKNTDFTDTIYFSPSMELSFLNIEEDGSDGLYNIYKEMEKEGFLLGQSKMTYTYKEELSEENIFWIEYDDALINCAKIPLSSGEWFSPNVENPIILSNSYKKQYKLGDEIILSEKVYQVCGFLNEENYIWDFGVSGTVNIGNMIRVEDEKVCLVYSSNKEKTWNDYGVLIQNKEKNNQLEVFRKELSNYGIITEMEEAIEDYNIYIADRLYNLIGINIALFVLTVTGIGAMNFMMYYTQRKEFAIYFLCGFGERALQKVALLGSAIIAIPPMIAMAFIGKFSESLFAVFNWNNIVMSMIVIMIILFLSFLPFYFIVRKERIVDLRKD